jgi:hypothetical protein
MVCFAALTAFGIFVLPRMFPPKVWVNSESYFSGFNNTVALLVLVAAAIIARILFKTSSEVLPTLRATRQGLSGWHVAAGFFPSLLILFVGALLTQYIQLLTDYTYFYPKLLQLVQGARLYTDVEFAYGPLQLYGPLLLTHLGIPNVWASFVFWSIEQLLGIWMLLDFVQRMGIPRRAKWILFYAFCLTAPLLLAWAPTPDSLFFRLIVAPFVILQIERIRNNSMWRYVVIALSIPLLFACFLEIGIAFSMMQVCSAVLDVLGGERQQSVYGIGSVAAGLVLAAALFPSHSLAAIFSFGRGGNASPMVPTLYTLIFIAAFLYLATKVPLRVPLSGNDRSFFLLFVYSTALLPLAMSGGYGHIYQEMPIFFIVLATLLARGKPVDILLAGFIVLVTLHTLGVPCFRADRRSYLKHFIPVAFADFVRQTSFERLGKTQPTVSTPRSSSGQTESAYPGILDGIAAVRVPYNLDVISAAEYDGFARSTRIDFGYFTDDWNLFTRAQLERKLAQLSAVPMEPVLIEDHRLGAPKCPVNSRTGHTLPRCEIPSSIESYLEERYRVVRSTNHLLLLEPR